MSLTKFVGLLAGSTLTLTGVSYGANEVNNDTATEIAQLKADLAALKAEKGEQWLTEQRAAQVRGIVQDVLADADTRASLQTTAATSGYIGTNSAETSGFFISSADGNFKLKVSALEQVRFVYNSVYNNAAATANVPGGVHNTWGFENRRTQAWFTGNVVDPSWTYALGITYNSQPDPYYNPGFGPNNFALGYAWVQKTWANAIADGNLWIRAGQFSTPWTQQSQLWSAGNTQMGEYSAFEYFYGVGLTTGLLAGWNNDFLKLQFSYSSGFTPFMSAMNTGSFTFNGWNSPTNSGVSLAGRVDVKLAGDWSQFENESSFKWENQQFGAKVGGAMLYQSPRSFNSAFIPGYPSPWGATLDAMIGFGGANITGQFAYIDDIGTLGGGDMFGFNVQGGFFFTDEFEVFGGWTWNSARNLGARIDGNICSVGGNWYIAKSNIKATVAAYIPVSVDPGFFTPSGMGLNTQQNNLSVMAQLQMQF